jgi:hypothetical protein
MSSKRVGAMLAWFFLAVLFVQLVIICGPMNC